MLTGYVGKLSMKLPWSNLKNEAIVIKLQDIYILATPQTDMKV
jgi:hypothetical protein